jgi:hypothetical protein
VQRIESLHANLEREKNEMTPRPPWPSAQEVLPGFAVNPLATSEETLGDLIQHFKDELSLEKRDNEKKALTATVRDWLGQEDLCESDLVGKHRYFVCKGTGAHVPVYLRAKGVVRNRKIRKGDLEKLLAKFWADRRLSIRIETNLNATPLAEFFHEWLVTLTGNQKAAVELAYNMLSVCEQYQLDPDCAMFLRIMRGELSEHAMFDQADMLANLRDVMVANDPRQKKFLSRFTIHRILNKFFSTKARQDMLRLRFALVLSCKGQTMVDYEQLFIEDEDGNQSRFVEMMRRQHVEEATVFTVEVEEALREAIRADGQLDLNNARMALKHLDPAMPNSRIEDLMAFGCSMTVSELDRYGQFFAIDAEPFLARLRRGVLLRRYSRRPTAEGESDAGSDSDDAAPDDDELERDRAMNHGASFDDEVDEIIIPEGRLRQTMMFSGETASSGADDKGLKLKGATATTAATAAGIDSPGAEDGKRRARFAQRRSEFDFLDAFTRRHNKRESDAAELAAKNRRRSSVAPRKGSQSQPAGVGNGGERVATPEAALGAIKEAMRRNSRVSPPKPA